MKARALYVFSGDPITLGHLDVIRRARQALGALLVGIGQNPAKQYLFDRGERLDLARQAVRGLPDVEVVLVDGLLTDFAYEQGIAVIVRGIRDASDFEAEKTLFHVARSQWPAIDFHYLMADPALAHVSSGAAKAIQLEHGFVQDLVPLPVKAALEWKISRRIMIGVTGEMGAGKSHVSRALVQSLRRRGVSAHHLDVDRLAHEILEQDDQPIYRQMRASLAATFGTPARVTAPFLDSRQLGEGALRSRAQAKQLEELLRAPLLLRIKRELAAGRGVVLLDSALLVESGLSVLCNHRVVMVGAPRNRCSERLLQRGMSPDAMSVRRALQCPAEQKRGLLQANIATSGFGEIWDLDNAADGPSRFADDLAQSWFEQFHLGEARDGSAAA